MPFRSVTTFEPEMVAILQQVHHDLCQSLTGPDGVGPGENARNALAILIMDCAKAGERDPEKLKACAKARLPIPGMAA